MSPFLEDDVAQIHMMRNSIRRSSNHYCALLRAACRGSPGSSAICLIVRSNA